MIQQVQWWGGPYDGATLAVQDGLSQVVIAEQSAINWATLDPDGPAQSSIERVRAVPIQESPDGRLWLVWKEPQR